MPQRQGQNKRKRPIPPLDKERLEQLALRYVERYATSRAKLANYLARKIRERGWKEGEAAADPIALAEKMADLGYVNDEAFATMKARSLSSRGYGRRRLQQTLRAAGIAEEDGDEALALADDEADAAALRFARRKRLGPFGPSELDPKQRQKAFAAMLRAGHDFERSRKILNMSSDELEPPPV